MKLQELSQRLVIETVTVTDEASCDCDILDILVKSQLNHGVNILTPWT